MARLALVAGAMLAIACPSGGERDEQRVRRPRIAIEFRDVVPRTMCPDCPGVPAQTRAAVGSDAAVRREAFFIATPDDLVTFRAVRVRQAGESDWTVDAFLTKDARDRLIAHRAPEGSVIISVGETFLSLTGREELVGRLVLGRFGTKAQLKAAFELGPEDQVEVGEIELPEY